MSQDDVIYTKCFDEGRRAGRIGMPQATNPYRDAGTERSAWHDGYAAVDFDDLIAIERIHLFHLGREAGERGETATRCPFVHDQNPERMEIWLLGYAPKADGEPIQNDNVRSS